MPRSHGGGYGGGGGRGSFSSGGSGGRSGPRFSSSRSFEGATRYDYVNSRGVPCFFFYAGVPHRSGYASVIVKCFAVLFVIIVFSVFLVNMVPRRLSAGKCKATGVYLADEVGVIDNRENFDRSMRAFYEKTGVEPFIYIFSEQSFPEFVYGKLNGYSLEDYAYDRYLDVFSDEGHFMIVFAIFENGDYLWLDMAGNDTEKIITDAVFSDFRRDMQSRLTGGVNAIGTALTYSFDELTASALEFDSENIIPLIVGCVVFLLFLGTLGYSIYSEIKKIKVINEYCAYEDGMAARNGSDGDLSGGADSDCFGGF